VIGVTRRIDSPDTQADQELHTVLDRRAPGFTMISGAGSGRTTSPVKALAHIVETHGAKLRRQAQQVACITYTEVAAAEIYADLAESPLAHVSTIHSFLWTVMASFQEDIRKWVRAEVETRIKTEQATAATGTGKKQTNAAEQAARYESILIDVDTIIKFRYGTGRDFAKGILGHHDVLTMVPQMIMGKPLLAKLVARRFPFILVDESQDTFDNVVKALQHIAHQHPHEFTLGFFGDPMQKIYTTGIGTIDVPDSWPALQKPENFRSASRILKLINAIRAQAGDPLEQRSGIDTSVQIDGEVTFIVLPTASRTHDLNRTQQWLAGESELGPWVEADGQPRAKILVIAHRMAARRLGFEGLSTPFTDQVRSVPRSTRGQLGR
jgi:DNA helicase II / ATP-dependent DNA helicase PcrA